MTVIVKMVNGARFDYPDAEDIVDNEDFVQVILPNGVISFPMVRIEWWEVIDG